MKGLSKKAAQRLSARARGEEMKARWAGQVSDAAEQRQDKGPRRRNHSSGQIKAKRIRQEEPGIATSQLGMPREAWTRAAGHMGGGRSEVKVRHFLSEPQLSLPGIWSLHPTHKVQV